MAKPESREMYGEIAALMASLSKALALGEADCIAALERGEIALAFDRDANGNRFVNATYAGKAVRIYQGAIKHAPEG